MVLPPKADIYVLNAIERELSTIELEEKLNLVIKLGSVSIPDILDQAQIVTRIGENRLQVDDFNRWGGDFEKDIQRTLAENISILLPTVRVVMNQEVSLLAVDYQIIVNVRKFDGELGGEITLNVDWSISQQGRRKITTAKKSILYHVL